MFTFIHAGDVHLGNPFTGLSQNLSVDFQDQVQSATFTALDRLVEFAVDQDVDLVLFPGDLYHGTNNSPLIQERLSQALMHLDQAGIWTAISFGNHDFQEGGQRHPTWPAHTIVFTTDVATKIITTKSGTRVALSAFSYANRLQRQSVLADFPNRDQSVDYHIGLYHGVVGQAGDPYAAFSLREMLAKGYDYWALGHIHLRQILHQKPVIAYSGNLQGLNRTETGEKGFYLVSETPQGLLPEFYPVAPVLWQDINLVDCPDLFTLQAALSKKAWQQPTLVTIHLTGHPGDALLAADRFGTLLESLQLDRPQGSDYWPVKVQVEESASQNPGQALPTDLDEHAAIERVVQPHHVAQWLSDQAPTFIRDYFYSPAGQADLAERLHQHLMGGRQDAD